MDTRVKPFQVHRCVHIRDEKGNEASHNDRKRNEPKLRPELPPPPPQQAVSVTRGVSLFVNIGAYTQAMKHTIFNVRFALLLLSAYFQHVWGKEKIIRSPEKIIAVMEVA